MADPEDVQDDADEAQATAEDADARAEAAESNDLPSGLTGAPPPEALPVGSATETKLGSGLVSPTRIQGEYAGLVEPGNIDLTTRPRVKNPDGSVSTVRSASFGLDGKEVLLPTVSDGPNARLLSDDEAVAQYRKTGKHLGKFANPDAADKYAQALHLQQESAYVPGGQSGEPVTSAAPTAPATPEEARQQEFAAGTEGVTAAQGRVSATEEGGDVEQRRLDAEEEARRNENIDRQADEQARIDTRDDFQKKVQAAEDNVKNFKFQDHFANESTARKAANAVAVFLGGLGNLGGQAPGSANYALQALEQHEKEDYDQQLAYLNSAKYLADKKREGYTDLLKQQSEDRRVAELNFAAKRAAITDEFAAQASQSRNKTAVAAAQEEVARRKADVAKRQTDVFRDIETEKYQQARGQAALLKANRHKGGTGGSGVGVDNAVNDVKQAIQDAEDAGHPLSEVEISKLASSKGIPLNAKAGKDSAKQIIADYANAKKLGVRLAGQARGEDEEVRKGVNDFNAQHGVKEIAKKQREIGSVLKELQDAGSNGLAQKLALEKAVSAARGGAASKQALALALGSLGGSLDEVAGKIQHIESGGLGKKQLTNLVNTLTGQLGAAQSEGKDASDAYDEFVEDQPEGKKAGYKAAKSRIFSGLHGFVGNAKAGTGQGQPELPTAQADALNKVIHGLGGGFKVVQP